MIVPMRCVRFCCAVRVTLATSPAGLSVKLDGQPVTTPLAFDGVVGIMRNLEATTPQSSGSTTYTFDSWSDGGAARHDIRTPAANTTFTATYRASGGGTVNGLAAAYYNNIDFTGTSVTRTDPMIDFTWGAGSPDPAIGVDTFSARWTGQIEAPSTGTFTFYTQSDDGVRLWVNGTRIVNNWTNHRTIENSGTIALTAGQRYDIQMDYYENTGSATARLLWSGPSVAKAVVPSSRLFVPSTSSTIRINYQTAAAPVPAGYLPDGGLVFGNRGNGRSYGWNADNTAQMRDRNAANSPDQRYDTLAYMQRPGNPDASWEIAVPNGTYTVRIVAGDPSFVGSTFAISAEDVVVISGVTNSGAPWLDASKSVTVADGRLTVRNAPGATSNKICFIEITPQP